MKNRAHLRMSPLIASLSAAAVIGALFIPAAAATSTPTVATALPPGQVRVVDPDVTPATASLFNYLQAAPGEATPFGHQDLGSPRGERGGDGRRAGRGRGRDEQRADDGCGRERRDEGGHTQMCSVLHRTSRMGRSASMGARG